MLLQLRKLIFEGVLASERVQRRLAAILAADVAGYSRLMHHGEEATHAKLTVLLADSVTPAITEHGGRIVKNTGDGVLAEFPSVVDAVRCAAQIQRGMIDREAEVIEDRRIKFRIGINLGDVIRRRGGHLRGWRQYRGAAGNPGRGRRGARLQYGL